MFDLLALLGFAVGIPLWLFTATAAARDVDRRGGNGRLVGVALVVVLPLGVVLWLAERRQPKASTL